MKTPSRPRAAPRTMQFAAVAGTMLLVAAALRYVGLTNDLWLDELWARRVALGMKSMTDALTLHHEVNHHLNSMWLYLVGADGTEAMYRLPSYLCGIGSVLVAGLIGKRRSTATGIIAMILTAASYELIVFSTEARGYSMAVLCTLLSFLFLEDFLEQPGWSAGVAYAAVASIGLLTQPVFTAILAAGCAWSLYRWLTSAPRSVQSAATRLGVHVVPVMAFVVLYLVDLRFVISGGGTATPSLIDAFGQSIAWTFGTPDTAAAKLVWFVVGIVLIDTGLRRLRTSAADWVYYAGAIVVFPNLLIILRGSEMIYTRHFLMGSALALVLAATVFGDWWARGRTGRIAATACIAAFVVANGIHLRTFAEHGRGQYRDAIRFMAEQTPGRPLTIGGDQDFRISMEVDYYLPKVLGAQGGRYYWEKTWPPGGPLWVIANADHYEAPVLPHNIYRDASGNEFEYVRTFTTSPLTGLHWFLFKNRAAR